MGASIWYGSEALRPFGGRREGQVEGPRPSPDFALAVPFHNEERLLPDLVAALRAQSARDVPVVFVDNASTDGSLALIRACPEVASGQWTCIQERAIGKIHAVKAAADFCTRELGIGHLALLDADSRPLDPDWLRTGVEITSAGHGRVGYLYSPLTYFDFAAWPVFQRAYLAYESVHRFVIANVGWTANGQGLAFPTDLLATYLGKADVTTEFDVRCSLLALAQGRVACLNPGTIATSGRRATVNPRNFAAWCFYERDYYEKKDINDARKLDLDAPQPVGDLRSEQVERFFQRRALKLASRHLVPLALFDRSETYLGRMETVLGLDVAARLAPATRRLPDDDGYLFTRAFESMILAIERDPGTLDLADLLAAAMREQLARA
jgi:glycosyltransferase involved in cell wall biosynthesis